MATVVANAVMHLVCAMFYTWVVLLKCPNTIFHIPIFMRWGRLVTHISWEICSAQQFKGLPMHFQNGLFGAIWQHLKWSCFYRIGSSFAKTVSITGSPSHGRLPWRSRPITVTSTLLTLENHRVRAACVHSSVLSRMTIHLEGKSWIWEGIREKPDKATMQTTDQDRKESQGSDTGALNRSTYAIEFPRGYINLYLLLDM